MPLDFDPLGATIQIIDVGGAVVLGELHGRTTERLVADLPGGRLELEWSGNGPVFMTGPAEEVFEGTWYGD